MVNILGNDNIVPELLQKDFNPNRLAMESIQLLNDQERRATMVCRLKNIRSQLGEPGAYHRAAHILSQFIQHH